jgi:hypothetical protein
MTSWERMRIQPDEIVCLLGSESQICGGDFSVCDSPKLSYSRRRRRRCISLCLSPPALGYAGYHY